MTAYAERIRRLRESTGLTQREMSAHLGVLDSNYDDLELYDDELFHVPSIQAIRDMCSLLRIPPIELCAPENAHIDTVKRVEYKQLVDIVTNHMVANSMSLMDFENAIGWKLEQFFEGEESFLEHYNISFLVDLSSRLRLNWLSLLPQARVAG